jgi:hypothetical protein
MSTPESIAEAFARGLMGAMLTSSKPEKAARPHVVKTEAVKEAVRQVVAEMLAQEEAPTPPQMDLFTAGIEDAPDDPLARAIREKVAQTQARAEAAERAYDEQSPGTYDPNDPERSPWTSPVQR